MTMWKIWRDLSVGAALVVAASQPAFAQSCGGFPLTVTTRTTVHRLDASGATIAPNPYFATRSDYGGVSISAAGVAYVAGTDGNVRFSPTGAVFATPAGGLEMTAFDAAGNLLVTDIGASRVSKISPAGAVSTILITSGLAGPVGIALDTVGNIYVSNFNDGTVRAFTAAGASLTTWGVNGVVSGFTK